MSVEWAYNPKFRYDSVYTPDDFAARCIFLMEDMADQHLRELLAIYIGWARNLSFREVIRWKMQADGSVIPCVRYGNLEIGPDGEVLG